MIVLSHPTGNTNVRETLKTLVELQQLKRFYTTLGFSSDSILFKKSWGKFFEKYLSRRVYDVPSDLLHTNCMPEAWRLIKRQLGCSVNYGHQSEVDRLCYGHDAYVAHQLAKESFQAVYAYEDSALETFKVAAKKNIRRIYELPIAYWERTTALIDEEKQRYPHWEPTLLSTRDSQDKLNKKTEEIWASTHVICPSQFVLDSIPPAVQAHKDCKIIHYGTSLSERYNTLNYEQDFHNPLKVLFAGTMTQRKGLADLFEAFKLINPGDAQLTVMGTPLLPLGFYKKHFNGFKFEPPRPHNQVLDLMSRYDLLVLPSIIEGRALVQLEALGVGLPILITANTGGSDLIREGENGFLVPIRRPDKIAERIIWFAKNREHLTYFKAQARQTARENTWIEYRKQLAFFLKNLL